MTPEERAELEELVNREEALDEDAQARFRDLESVYAEHERAAKVDAERKALAEKLRLDTPLIVESTEPSYDPEDDAREVRSDAWDRDIAGRMDVSPDELMSRAISAAEETPGPTDRRREAMVNMLERHGDERMARIVLASTAPAYKRAFAKQLRGGGQAGDLTQEERQAWDFTGALVRAMSVGTDAGGGYLVPTDIEPSVTLTADGTNNPLYNLARRVQTVGDTFRVVGSPNAAWSWDGENTEVSDDTPAMTNTDITLYVAQGFVPVSIRAAQGVPNVFGVAQDVLNAGWNDLVGAALTTGTGSSQPVGIVTALTGTGNEVSSATTDVFAVADVYSVHETLAARHRRNSTWLANIGIINDIRQFATDDGHALLSRLGDGQPGTILGRPVVENEDMDGVINAAADNRVLVLGDFQHFVIAEAIGTLVEIIPHVMGANGRPIGARGVYMQSSFGSDSVNDGAFAMLNVT